MDVYPIDENYHLSPKMKYKSDGQIYIYNERCANWVVFLKLPYYVYSKLKSRSWCWKEVQYGLT